MLAAPASRSTGASTASLGDFMGDRFLMFPREFAPGLHDIIAGILSHAGLHGRMVVAAPDWYAILGLVSAGSGLAVVPASMARCRLPGLGFLPLSDTDQRSTIAAIHKAGEKVGAVKKLVEYLRAMRARTRLCCELQN
jgi:DNA-binding transcriptional LysR family regulator